MALTHTADELVNKAAAILGKYVPGEALGSVEHDTLDRCVDDVLEEIGKIISIPDRDEIPNLVFETVARLVALYAASEFSNQPVDLAAVYSHDMRLRYLIAQNPTYEILQPNFC